MKARLFCTTGLFAGSNFEFTQEATIGKHQENSIVLAPPIISSRHARIYFDEKTECYFLEDLGSRNGTQVDGVRIMKKEKLEALNIVTFAQKFDFIFQVIDNYERAPVEKKAASRNSTAAVKSKSQIKKMQDETAEALPAPGATNGKTWGAAVSTKVHVVPVKKTVLPHNGKTLIEAMAVAKKMAPSRRAFLLEISSKGRRAKTYPLKEGENFLGRSPQCEIEIDDPSISRRHAVLTVTAGKVFLKDLGSRNHTFVGNQTVLAEAEIRLDTELRFGNVEAQLIQRVPYGKNKASSLGQLV
jgi:pSer/pThr/pTyr-binding forkhead associated (FHA) protein